jgi:hypothetical protein
VYGSKRRQERELNNLKHICLIHIRMEDILKLIYIFILIYIYALLCTPKFCVHRCTPCCNRFNRLLSFSKKCVPPTKVKKKNQIVMDDYWFTVLPFITSVIDLQQQQQCISSSTASSSSHIIYENLPFLKTSSSSS